MFTGIVTDVGEIAEAKGDSFRIRCRFDPETIAIGASISCAGCCLTVTDVQASAAGAEFQVDVSNETRSKTNLKAWQLGTNVNLERSLKAGDELGGHVVTGHIDGIARIADIYPDGDCQRFVFEAPDHLAMYIAPKGSVAVDGTSLTVNEVAGSTFGVNLIPHSLTVTTWGARQVDDEVNIEVDLFARYVARLLEYRK
ncbi:MAG: riboflavin synthase [Hyphomicrobiaceae bacterium]